MSIVARIFESRNTKYTKIVALWAITQMNRNSRLSDDAWNAIKKLSDEETALALAMITGHAVGMGATISKYADIKPRLMKLIPRNVIIVPGEF